VIALGCKQGSEEWHFARLGIPTASQFSRILTPAKREYAKGAETYMHELLAEWLTGIPFGSESSGFMERGIDQEAKAVEYYEFERNVTVSRVGVCLRDDKLVGCSPDFLEGDDSGGEVKVPSAKNHIANLLNGTEDHFAQVQGNMWIAERKKWNLISYHSTLPKLIVPITRDDAYLLALDKAMTRFLGELAAARQRLLDLGAVPAKGLDAAFRSGLAMKPGAENPF